jgi:Arb2 domain
VVLIGAGQGCYGIEHLIRNRDVSELVKGVVNVFGDVEPKSVGDDEDKYYWYFKVCLVSNIILIADVSSIYWSEKSSSTTEKDTKTIWTMSSDWYVSYMEATHYRNWRNE